MCLAKRGTPLAEVDVFLPSQTALLCRSLGVAENRVPTGRDFWKSYMTVLFGGSPEKPGKAVFGPLKSAPQGAPQISGKSGLFGTLPGGGHLEPIWGCFGDLGQIWPRSGILEVLDDSGRFWEPPKVVPDREWAFDGLGMGKYLGLASTYLVSAG